MNVESDELILDDTSPLLLRRLQRKPQSSLMPIVANMTVVTTAGNIPEKHDQEDDATRYDKD